MTLKWASTIVAAASAGSFATANVLLGAKMPAAANMALVAIAAACVVLVVVADLYQRLDARLGVLSEFLVARLDEIAGRLDRLESRGLESLLGEEPAPSTVVPLVRRRTRR